MSTGTVQNPALQVIRNMRGDSLQYTFTNGEASTALVPGDEVYLDTDGEVLLRTTGATIPLGVVIVGGEAGERVTVRSFFTMEMVVINNSGGDIDSGTALIPEGTKNSDGYPEYTSAVSTNLSCALALTAATDGNEITVGVFDSIFIQA